MKLFFEQARLSRANVQAKLSRAFFRAGEALQSRLVEQLEGTTRGKHLSQRACRAKGPGEIRLSRACWINKVSLVRSKRQSVGSRYVKKVLKVGTVSTVSVVCTAVSAFTL